MQLSSPDKWHVGCFRFPNAHLRMRPIRAFPFSYLSLVVHIDMFTQYSLTRFSERDIPTCRIKFSI